MRTTVERLNEFIRVHRDDYLSGLLMWHHTKQGRSEDRYPEAIPASLYRSANFIFLGRYGQVSAFDADVVLGDFDRLLPLYEFAQLGKCEFPILEDGRGFIFSPETPLGRPERRFRTEARRPAELIEVDLRHNRLQDKLEDELRSEVGEAVRAECPNGVGGFVDLVAKRGAELEFYEIKVGLTARSCLRQVLGQLMEYGFWPGAGRPARLFVVGEPGLDSEAETYLEYLQGEFGLPLYYRQVILT